eukprot:CAMPEP_0170264234 /NCGR_PEP_ID=MMETSP0116_2-20130129/32011_1 /TAXON_ID=400756 /ORGANISM="Durinskia baltica, Strain CSIRO CS-38" /LENGTH=32 /DNA_ID= /DNA_START= /DNA_END= /DNA_ORIENTATION=
MAIINTRDRAAGLRELACADSTALLGAEMLCR